MTNPTPAPRRLPLIALLISNAISWMGDVLSTIAIPWYVLVTTGSATKTGITGFFTILPTVLMGFFGGALVDRLGYKRTTILASIASGLSVLLIPVLDQTVGLAFWQLQVLVFLGALFDAPGGTARYAILPDLAEMAQIPNERAAAWFDAAQRAARMIGAPLAGVLIGFIGTANLLWLDALSFALSAALVAIAVPTIAHRDETQPSQSYWADMRDGLRFVWGNRLLVTVTSAVLVTNMIDTAFGSVVMPVYANRILGSAVSLGFISAAFGVGALLGAAWYGTVATRLPRYTVYVVAFVILSLRYWVFSFFPPLPVIFVTSFLTGIAAAPLNPILSAMEYEQVPPPMRARVFGTLTATAYLAMPLGVLLSGGLVDGLGLYTTILGMAVLYTIVTVSQWMNPILRGMNAKRAVAEAVVS